MSPYTSIPYLLNEDHNLYFMGFPDGTVGKESACQSRQTQETQVRSLGQEDPLA